MPHLPLVYSLILPLRGLCLSSRMAASDGKLDVTLRCLVPKCALGCWLSRSVSDVFCQFVNTVAGTPRITFDMRWADTWD